MSFSLYITGRTVLVIAHRLSTIRNADIIAVLADGQIREVSYSYIVHTKEYCSEKDEWVNLKFQCEINRQCHIFCAWTVELGKFRVMVVYVIHTTCIGTNAYSSVHTHTSHIIITGIKCLYDYSIGKLLLQEWEWCTSACHNTPLLKTVYGGEEEGFETAACKAILWGSLKNQNRMGLKFTCH